MAGFRADVDRRVTLDVCWQILEIDLDDEEQGRSEIEDVDNEVRDNVGTGAEDDYLVPRTRRPTSSITSRNDEGRKRRQNGKAAVQSSPAPPRRRTTGRAAAQRRVNYNEGVEDYGSEVSSMAFPRCHVGKQFVFTGYSNYASSSSAHSLSSYTRTIQLHNMIPRKVEEVGPSGAADDDESFNPAGGGDDNEEDGENSVASLDFEDEFEISARGVGGRAKSKGKGRSGGVSPLNHVAR